MGDSQLRAQITLTRGLYTKADLVLKVQLTAQTYGSKGPQKVSNQDKTFRGELRIVGQEEVYERVEQTVKSQAGGGVKGYFRAYRLGYDSVAIDPDQVVPFQNW